MGDIKGDTRSLDYGSKVWSVGQPKCQTPPGPDPGRVGEGWC